MALPSGRKPPPVVSPMMDSSGTRIPGIIPSSMLWELHTLRWMLARQGRSSYQYGKPYRNLVRDAPKGVD
jgi:hypothetical protein